MAGSDSWCLIESDPGVFTELVQNIGVKGVAFEELYGLEETAFTGNGPSDGILGYIFLFKWTPQHEQSDTRHVDQYPDHDLFFAQQVIQNACATQAILSVLMNLPETDIGNDLKAFKEFTSEFSYADRGMAIGSSEVIRKAHNSFRRISSFEFANDGDSDGEDSFHFISYVPFKDKIYELDGLKSGPILLGHAAGDKSWQMVVREEIQKRVDRLQNSADGKSEIRFSLMAVTVDRLEEMQKKIEQLRHTIQRINIKMVSCGEEVTLDDVDDEMAPDGTPNMEELPEDVEGLKQVRQKTMSQLNELKEQEKDEVAKRTRWNKENMKRRHDFVPFLLCAMRHMARRNELRDAFAKGKEEAAKKATTTQKGVTAES